MIVRVRCAVLCLLMLVSLLAPAVVLAQDAGPVITVHLPNPDADGIGFMKTILDAVMSNNWAAVAALATIGLVWAVRKFCGRNFPWVTTDRGGAVLVMVTAIAGGLATSLAAGAGLSKDVLIKSIYLGFMAAGGWTWIRRMLGQKNT